ncbi:hypothetical protein [Nostoc sp.]|uniref:hypothetical protein n=1 Tax=Nostoc sp. TaxID=1180 RepID=UPI003FA58C2D
MADTTKTIGEDSQKNFGINPQKFYINNTYRYEAVFNIIWHCAKNLTYPDFHKAIN